MGLVQDGAPFPTPASRAAGYKRGFDQQGFLVQARGIFLAALSQMYATEGTLPFTCTSCASRPIDPKRLHLG